MERTYIVKTTKYGKNWKRIGEGLDFLEDNKIYRLDFYADGLIKAIRAKIAFKRNKRFKFQTYNEYFERNAILMTQGLIYGLCSIPCNTTLFDIELLGN